MSRHYGFYISILSYLPSFLFPGSSILSILLPLYRSSFLRTCPNQPSLRLLVSYPNLPTGAVPLMYSFLILSIIVASSTLPRQYPPPALSSVSASSNCIHSSRFVHSRSRVDLDSHKRREEQRIRDEVAI